MLIYVSVANQDSVNRGRRAVPTDREGVGRSAPVRDPRTYRPAGGGRLSPAVRLLPRETSDDFPPPEGTSQCRLGGVATGRTVRVLQNPAGRARGVHG